jgi:hypothetical protein
MKRIAMIITSTVILFGWEINTHRAIDRQATNHSSNFQYFIDHSGVKNSNYRYEKFEGYGQNMTYINYVLNGENNGISSDKWQQAFNVSTVQAQDLIEAGSILEDAQWPHWLDGGDHNYYDIGDGRFNNHFYDPQKGGKGLSFGYGDRTDAITWATGEETKGESL